MCGGGEVFVPPSHLFSVARPSLAGAAGALPVTPCGRGAAPAFPAGSWGPPLAPRAWAPTACAPRSRSGGSAAGERRARRSGACMAPGALVCVCVAGEGRARCPASCCSAARLPCRFIFRSAAIGPRAARLGSARPGRAGAGRAGLQRGVPAEPPGTPARLCSPNAAPGSRLRSKLAELGIPG